MLSMCTPHAVHVGAERLKNTVLFQLPALGQRFSSVLQLPVQASLVVYLLHATSTELPWKARLTSQRNAAHCTILASKWLVEGALI